MNTFPTWHRPYLFLFEVFYSSSSRLCPSPLTYPKQAVVHEEMVKQAKAYPDENDRNTYLDAAASFRLPYWDLIMPRNAETNSDPTTIWGCPDILKAKEVYVKLPEDDPEKDAKGFSKIKNPLYNFAFPNDQERDQHPERKGLKMPSQ